LKALNYNTAFRLDDEFLNMVEGEKNWFDMYKCRLAAASGLSSSLTVILILALFCFVLRPLVILHR
jgi:hypothetical protein